MTVHKCGRKVFLGEPTESEFERFKIEQKPNRETGAPEFYFVSFSGNVLQCSPSGGVSCDNPNRLEWEAMRVIVNQDLD